MIYKWLVLPCLLLLHTLYFSCTSNPIGDENLQEGKRALSGQVEIEGYSLDDVYVWLEGFNIGAKTDKTGKFTLTIPSSQNNISGVFNLYFYISNFLLESVEVAVIKGEFAYGQGPVTNDGQLKQKTKMTQFLKIATSLIPLNINPKNSTQTIKITTTFSTTGDKINISIPNAIPGSLGPVIFQNIKTGEIFLFNSIPLQNDVEFSVGITPIKLEVSYVFNTLNLPDGSYKAFPFIILDTSNIPVELINSIGNNVLEFSPNYLKLPFKRDGGEFSVK